MDKGEKMLEIRKYAVQLLKKLASHDKFISVTSKFSGIYIDIFTTLNNNVKKHTFYLKEFSHLNIRDNKRLIEKIETVADEATEELLQRRSEDKIDAIDLVYVYILLANGTKEGWLILEPNKMLKDDSFISELDETSELRTYSEFGYETFKFLTDEVYKHFKNVSENKILSEHVWIQFNVKNRVRTIEINLHSKNENEIRKHLFEEIMRMDREQQMYILINPVVIRFGFDYDLIFKDEIFMEKHIIVDHIQKYLELELK